jgi:hypothetical protein
MSDDRFDFSGLEDIRPDERTVDFNTDLEAGGVKFDVGKERIDLLPPNAMLALADLFARGAEKYAARNWEKGMDVDRQVAALGRHLFAFMAGEKEDPDPLTGMHHMIHIAWNALVAYELEVTGQSTYKGTELRPVGGFRKKEDQR